MSLHDTVLRIHANPGTFDMVPSRAALIVIDMQRDFLEPGGFGAALELDGKTA